MCTGFVWAFIATQFIYKLDEGVQLYRVQLFLTKYDFKNVFYWHLLYYYTFVHEHNVLTKLSFILFREGTVKLIIIIITTIITTMYYTVFFLLGVVTSYDLDLFFFTI
jgi:hypothetical protein